MVDDKPEDDPCSLLHGPTCQESCLWETGAPGRDRARALREQTEEQPED